MLHKILTLLLFILLLQMPYNTAFANQSGNKFSKIKWKNGNWETGILVGTSKYFGDLTSNNYLSTQDYNFAISTHLKYQVHHNFGFRINATYAKLTGDDKHQSSADLINRNLNFSTQIAEVALGVEYFPFKFSPCKNMIRPYLFAELGAFYFNPTAKIKGKVTYLKPLSTEGEGLAAYPDIKPYSLIQICFPIGAGFKWQINKRWVIGMELGIRKTLTDYIDDVSSKYPSDSILLANKGITSVYASNPSLNNKTIIKGKRGNPKNKDVYAVGGIYVAYTIKTWCYKYYDGGLFRNKKSFCPKF